MRHRSPFRHSVRRARSRPRAALAMGCLLLVIAVLIGACGGSAATPTPAPTATAAPSAAPAGASPQLPAGLPSGNDVKIDSAILDVVDAFRQGGRAPAEAKARETGLLNAKNEILVTLILADANTQPIVDKVKGMGGLVGTVIDNMIDIRVPLDVLVNYASGGKNFMQDLAAFESVKEVQVTRLPQSEGFDFPPGMAIAEAQPLIAAMVVEGVAVTGADRWHAAGITGKGIKIGVLDGGFQGYQQLLGKELPQQVGFKSFTSDGGIGNGVHGTAVAEIVHAMAPDAELILVPFGTQAEFAAALRYLVDEAKVQVLQMSFGWHDTRGDGTGFTHKQIDYAREKGVLPVKSAGNEGDSHYTATFAPGAGGRHQFAGKDKLQVGGRDGRILLFLIWDAWSGTPVNYDLYVVDEQNNRVASSRNVQGSNKTPFEAVYYEGKPNTRYYAVIEAVGQQPGVRLDLFGKNTPLEPVSPGSTPLTSISAPGDAKGAFTVGAINFQDDKLEEYSSQGPTLDGRQKPDISGLARVTTAGYRGQPFYGTSAACPHVSGAAALVLSAQPGATAAQVQAFLVQNAKDLEDAGPESKTGSGRLAMGPVENARTPAGPTGNTPSAAPSARPTSAPSARPSAAPRPSSAPASARPSAAPSQAPMALRPNGPIPDGWKEYVDRRASFAIAYPPDWQAESNGASVNFSPGPGSTLFQVTAVSNPTPGASLEELLDLGYKQVLGTCDNTEVLATGDDRYSGITFADMNASCTRGQEALLMYLAAGERGSLVWYLYVIGPADTFSDDADAYYDPMLTTLNIGGSTQAAPPPSARPSAAPTARPSAAPSARPSAAPSARPSAAPSARPQPSATARPQASAAPSAPPMAPPAAGGNNYSVQSVGLRFSVPEGWTVVNDEAGTATFQSPDGQALFIVRWGTAAAGLTDQQVLEEELNTTAAVDPQFDVSGVTFSTGLVGGQEGLGTSQYDYTLPSGSARSELDVACVLPGRFQYFFGFVTVRGQFDAHRPDFAAILDSIEIAP